mgnify:CR=1 FL=1
MPCPKNFVSETPHRCNDITLWDGCLRVLILNSCINSSFAGHFSIMSLLSHSFEQSTECLFVVAVVIRCRIVDHVINAIISYRRFINTSEHFVNKLNLASISNEIFGHLFFQICVFIATQQNKVIIDYSAYNILRCSWQFSIFIFLPKRRI